MMTRRDLVRTLALLSVAAGAPGALGGCGADDEKRNGGLTMTEGDLRLVSADVPRGTGLPEAVPDVVSALRRLAGGLYGELAAKPGNLALSPYSIGVALAMTANGAGGATAQEMRAVLGAGDLARHNAGLNALTRSLEALAGTQERGDGSTAEIALDAANQLFGQHDTPWTEAFLEVLAREYGAGLRTVDFEAATAKARELINAWTAGQTHDRIPEIIPDGVLDALTRLVLVNAIYLKAPWETPFEKHLTSARPFHGLDGTVDVPTMGGSPDAMLAEGDGWRSARILYAGRQLAMTIVLPDSGRLADVEAAVVGGDLDGMLNGTTGALLDLRLPRWTFRTEAPLRDVLSALGMPTAFDEVHADFLAMTDDDLQLFISAVLHQAFIAVNEEGTEAAAATAVVMTETSAPMLEEFHVDRPFLFVIHDVAHGTPLFLGRVTDPAGTDA